MAHRVPVVVPGDDAVSRALLVLLHARADDLAGTEGHDLQPAERLGPEPSVLVDTRGDVAALRRAVHGGHAAVTSSLALPPTDLVVLRSDRRLGVSAALLPGLPLLAVLERAADAGDAVREVLLDGPDREQLLEEAAAVSALLGEPLPREQVRLGPDAPLLRARVRPGAPPRVEPLDGDLGGARRAVVSTDATPGLVLQGVARRPEQVAAALLSDLLALVRERDTPWRAARRAAAS